MSPRHYNVICDHWGIVCGEASRKSWDGHEDPCEGSVSQVLSDWLYSCLQLDAMIFLHSIPSFFLMLSLCFSHFQHIRSQRQENSHIFVICWSDEQWTKEAFPSTPPDLPYNFCMFCNKIMGKGIGTKISLYFFDAFIRSSCYSLIADRVGSTLTGPLFFSSILGK